MVAGIGLVDMDEQYGMIVDLVKRLESRQDKFDEKLDKLTELVQSLSLSINKLESRIEANSAATERLRNDSIPRIHERIEEVEQHIKALEARPAENWKRTKEAVTGTIITVVVTGIAASILTKLLPILFGG